MTTHLTPTWPRLRTGLLLAAPALLVTACGGSSSANGGAYGSGQTGTASTSSSSTTTVETHSGDLGTFLTDGSGRTLYLFAADNNGMSACSGACAAGWPPVTTDGSPAATGQARSALLGTVVRSDGSTQVTYGGHPLYYYAGDQSAGDTNGEGSDGFGARWWVVSPAGRAVTQQTGAGTAGQTSGQGAKW